MVDFLQPSDPARVDLDQSSVSDKQLVRLVVDSPEEKRHGVHITKTVSIHPHHDTLLCPVKAFLMYQDCIASAACHTPYPVIPTHTVNCLFRSLRNNTEPIGPERISKHLQQIIQYVKRPDNVPLPKARAPGATLAAQGSVSVEDIVVQGNWSSKDISEQFYRISTSTAIILLCLLWINNQYHKVRSIV